MKMDIYFWIFDYDKHKEEILRFYDPHTLQSSDSLAD